MIQRKQTLYLLLAMVAVIVCLTLSLVTFEPRGMGLPTSLTNFCLTDGNGETSFMPLPLACLLLLSLPDMAVAIMSYKNRKLQSTLCLAGMIDMALWYAYFAYQTYSQLSADPSVSYHLAAVLPLVTIVLLWLARRGVLADEALVRAADRIR